MTEREWVLLNPGSANTSRPVRQALLTPDLCHREPEVFEVMREYRERLVHAAGCAGAFAAVLFTGSGTAAVEAAVCSAVPRDRSLLVVKNGVYAFRVSNRGTLSPRDMEAVVAAFADVLDELGVAAGRGAR